MNTFYSIVYCPIRSVADERVSIALLLRSNEQVFFRFSHDKLKIIKELLPEPSYRLLKAHLKNFELFFQQRREQSDFDHIYPDIVPKLPDFVSASYIDYLNRYGNNLLHFSKPSALSVDVNEEVYNILYHQFVYESDQIIERDITIYEKVRMQVNPVIKTHVNLDIELTSNEVENLVVPTKVWFIGQNEVDVTGEIFDFEKMTYHLEHEITKHLNLIHTLQEGSPLDSTHFVVGKEPARKNRANHSLWNNIRKLDYVRYIPLQDLDAINEYMKEHHVSPYIPSIKTENTEPQDDEYPF